MNIAPVRTWLFLGGLLVIALMFVRVWRDRGLSEFTASPVAQMPAATDVADGGVADESARSPDAAVLDRPLFDRIPPLRARAQAGDAKAACQLALERSACRAVAKREDMSRAMEYAAATSESVRRDARVIDAIATVRESAVDVAEECAGIESEGDTDVVALLQAAAPTGNARQRVIAALIQPDGSLLRLPRGPVHTLPMDPWVSSMASQFYADNALRYLHEGFRARDPLALEGLILVHAPDVLVPSASTDAAFRLPDPRRFVALALLAEEVYGSDMLGSQVRQLLQRTLEILTDKERGLAESDSKRWALTWRTSALVQPPDARIDAFSIDAVCR